MTQIFKLKLIDDNRNKISGLLKCNDDDLMHFEFETHQDDIRLVISNRLEIIKYRSIPVDQPCPPPAPINSDIYFISIFIDRKPVYSMIIKRKNLLQLYMGNTTSWTDKDNDTIIVTMQ